MADKDIVLAIDLEKAEVIKDIQARIAAIEATDSITRDLGTIEGLLKKDYTLAVTCRRGGGAFFAEVYGQVTSSNPYPFRYLSEGRSAREAIARIVLMIEGRGNEP